MDVLLFLLLTCQVALRTVSLLVISRHLLHLLCLFQVSEDYPKGGYHTCVFDYLFFFFRHNWCVHLWASEVCGRYGGRCQGLPLFVSAGNHQGSIPYYGGNPNGKGNSHTYTLASHWFGNPELDHEMGCSTRKRHDCLRMRPRFPQRVDMWHWVYLAFSLTPLNNKFPLCPVQSGMRVVRYLARLAPLITCSPQTPRLPASNPAYPLTCSNPCVVLVFYFPKPKTRKKQNPKTLKA